MVRTIKKIRESYQKLKTILWNGPLVFSNSKTLRHGTRAVAEAIAEATNKCIPH